MALAGLPWLLAVWPSARLSASQCPDGTPPPCRGTPARAPAANSVAVLYFENLSPDTADAGIADGLTEELIARLSQVPGLRVASRYAAVRYRGRRALDPRVVGRELSVRYVLQGTLRRFGERVRIALEITDAGRGFNVWGQTYDRPLREIFTAYDTVAVQVVEAVRGRLTSGERLRLASSAPSVDPDAYQALLRGRAAIRARTESSAAAAVASYRRAATLAPAFAPAHAALATALSLALNWGWRLPGMSPDSVQVEADAEAARALALDSASAESWLAAAMAMRAHDERRALELTRRAVLLDSTSVEALHQLAWAYLGIGVLDSSIALERRVLARDPYYAYAYAGLAEMLNVTGRPAEALAAASQGLAIDSSSAPLYWQIADATLQQHRAADARVAADRAAALGFNAAGARILRMLALLQEGDTAAVRTELPDLERALLSDPARSRGGLGYSAAVWFSGLYAQLGDAAASVQWATRVAEWTRRFYAVVFARHWLWAPVRGDARFQSFLASLRS